jgi:hypothetical protein
MKSSETYAGGPWMKPRPTEGCSGRREETVAGITYFLIHKKRAKQISF